MKTIQLNISDKAYKKLKTHGTLKNLLPENITLSDSFLHLILEAIREGKEEKTIRLKED